MLRAFGKQVKMTHPTFKNNNNEFVHNIITKKPKKKKQRIKKTWEIQEWTQWDPTTSNNFINLNKQTQNKNFDWKRATFEVTELSSDKTPWETLRNIRINTIRLYTTSNNFNNLNKQTQNKNFSWKRATFEVNDLHPDETP